MYNELLNAPERVALYARAWVEICNLCIGAGRQKCRPLREGVGRNILGRASPIKYIRRPLREGVGRNGARAIWYLTGLPVALYARAWVEIDLMIEKMNDLESRPLREGVGRNHQNYPNYTNLTCRPLREGVGRNCVAKVNFDGQPPSPSTRGRG